MARSPAPAIAVILGILVAGCIENPQNDPAREDQEPRLGGEMTAAETQEEKTDLCTEGDLGLTDRFCATRTIRVTGTIAGFDLLDVDLETFNGDIGIEEAAGESWSFTATLRARGATADEAARALDDIAFRWSHEDARGHFVEVVAKHEGDSASRSAEIQLRFPRATAMRIVAATSNGDITLAGARTDGASLTTSNGKIVAHGDATQVAFTSSNGDIEATLRPTASARWSLTTSNGDVTMSVPEGERYGYQIEGTTSNGEVDHELRDGTQGPCPEGSQYYTPPCDHRTFETRDLGRRPIRVTADLVTSNGDVSTKPT